ncbi:MAG: type II toxin-antitoxin system RelB/DinJ family antitoxin [Pseudomonadota bacterium]
MSKIARARMDDELKDRAEQILKSIGLSASDAIRLLYKQIIIRSEFPLELKVPNSTTLAAFEEGDKNLDQLDNFSSFNELLNDKN